MKKIIGMVVLAVGLASGAASAAVPYQFIAKQYSEVLGRAPDQAGWAAYVSGFNSSGCSQATLKNYGRSFYLSDELLARGYNNSEKVFLAFRGVLDREPNFSEFNAWVGQLNTGTAWATVVDSLFSNAEFAALVPSICMGSSYQAAWLRPSVLTSSRSQSNLQAQLNAGGIVTLGPQEVVYLTSTLVIPAGSTLRTNAVDGNHTARFGRLVRDSSFDGPLVELRGTMEMVWVDGQRGRLGFTPGAINVNVLQGTVRSCRISEPAGWTNLHAPEWCNGPATITSNLVTGYSTSHIGQGFADGLSLACSGTTARYNNIIDPTDVGIVVFSRWNNNAWSGTNTVVQNNTIIAAGRSAYGGVGFDAIGQTGADFTGALIQDNLLWTSPLQHFDIGLFVGTEPWDSGTGKNGTALGNTTGNLNIYVHLGIVIDGMENGTVQSNAFYTMGVNTGIPCPQDGAVSAHFGPHASGSLMTPATNRAVHHCMGHPL
ncbi:DUF4214 domain-containing protein [Archangium sp.]|uniref:DUF4214 domain-containing protein n=1 Tax=Archangium sp. TaxID=1872627 RepID=UPI003899E96C